MGGDGSIHPGWSAGAEAARGRPGVQERPWPMTLKLNIHPKTHTARQRETGEIPRISKIAHMQCATRGRGIYEKKMSWNWRLDGRAPDWQHGSRMRTRSRCVAWPSTGVACGVNPVPPIEQDALHHGLAREGHWSASSVTAVRRSAQRAGCTEAK